MDDISTAILPSAPKWSYGIFSRLGKMAPDVSAYEGANDLPYGLPNIQVDYIHSDPGVPVNYWRSVGHSHNGFVTEGFIDELAHAANQDPGQFRYDLLSDIPAAQKVLKLAMDESGWNQKKGVHQGIAIHRSFNSWVAQVADVRVDNKKIIVDKVTCVVDCGTVVNPDIVKAQMEGGIIFALTAALYGEITLKDGAVEQSNFHDYPILRMSESPDIDVHIVDSNEAPTGVGEPGVPPLAPAVANAVFSATGQRLRSLPLRLA